MRSFVSLPSSPSSHSTARQDPHLDLLDGFRGIAVLTVLMLHLWQLSWVSLGPAEFLATTGMIGVNLFFFISGFCLYVSYARRPHVGDYVRRRAAKILPSYWLCMAVILIFFRAQSGLTGATTGKIFSQVLTHLFFVHNLWPETSGTINGVFWSLGVEVQFYVLFPVLFLVFQKRPKLAAFSFLVLALAFRLTIAGGDPGLLDFRMAQLPAFLDFFGLGMLAAHLNAAYPPSRRMRTVLLAIASFAAYMALLYWAHTTRYVPGITAWQVVGRTWLALSFFVMTRYGLAAGTAWMRVVANPVLVFLSTISYNLYLWHQFIGRRLLESRIPNYLGTDPHDDVHWQILFTVTAVVASVAVSALLTYLFERPILRASHR